VDIADNRLLINCDRLSMGMDSRVWASVWSMSSPVRAGRMYRIDGPPLDIITLVE